MPKPIKFVEKAVTLAAGAAWSVFDKLNQINPNPSFTPKWSDKPLLKSWEKYKPPLGWPRETDSLCPKCVPEMRKKILDGDLPVDILRNEKVGEIKAQIIERDGKILMVKDCPKHGHFEDLMSIDPAFYKHLEEAFPGRDIPAHNDKDLHKHGTSTITHGRGSVLTIDLTNRCNMMCDPCFMDANQVGFVHELTWEDIQTLLDNAMRIKPKRQMSVQFSGGEPTLSPHFLEAVAYARKVGYNSVQAATNGIEFAKSPEFCRKAGRGRSSLRLSAIRWHRQRRQFPSRRRQPVRREDARHREPVVERRRYRSGDHHRERRQQRAGRRGGALRSRQPEEEFRSSRSSRFRSPAATKAVTDERRQGAALYALAPGARREGSGGPRRAGARLVPDLVHEHVLRFRRSGARSAIGLGPVELRLPSELRHRLAVMCDKETKEAVPVTAFLNADRLAKDIARINDAARSRNLSVLGVTLALLRNYDPFKSPTHFRLSDLVAKFDKCFGMSKKAQTGGYGKVTGDRTMTDIQKRRADRWNFLFIAGMWFQDLFNYDFRRTEQCIIPYATQDGEISFCAYNTGIGWRNIIEKMHMTATLTKWYEEHGRHEIFAGGKKVELKAASTPSCCAPKT